MRPIRIKLDAKGRPIGYISVSGRIVGDDEICLEIALERLGVSPLKALPEPKDSSYLDDLLKYSRQGK